MKAVKEEVHVRTLGEIELELSKLGVHNRYWGRAEIKELQHILSEDEPIKRAASGRYDGGFALLVTTDRRLLLIDKKVWFLNLEDVRFDMISEVDYTARLLDSTLSVRTFNKILRFTTIRQKQLRDLTTYLQERVMELRHQSMGDMPAVYSQAFQPQPYAQQPLPLPAQPIVTDQTIPQMQVPDAPGQQFYATQINYNRPSRLRRIGAYPTSSLTMQRRASR